MNCSKTFTIGLLFYSFLVFGLGKAKAGMTTVLSDDYDAVWDSTPIPADVLGSSYIGVPNVSGGVARGIGSGYTDPLYTWMVEPLVFTANKLEVTLRGQSGLSLPNEANVWLMDASWGGHGQPGMGYRFRIKGEGNRKFEISKMGSGSEVLATYDMGSTITDWHTYVVSRDEAGNWALTVDDTTVSLSSMNPDLTYTDFTHIGSFLYRDQSALDYVEFKVPEPAIEATVNIDPDTLNLNSKGKWITCYIELSEDYDVEDIDVSTVKLNDQVPAESHPTGIGDYDNDGIPDLMVKFDRSAVQEILQAGDEVEITVTGELTDGTPFEGSDTIRVIDKGGKK